MKSIEELLKQSINEYNIILSKAKEIENLLTKMGSEETTKQASRMETLLSKSQITDTDINNRLKQDPTIHSHSLFIQRSKIMGEILAKNKEISPKIQGILAVYKTEFQKMRTGMNSFSGYAQDKNTTGKLVSNKF